MLIKHEISMSPKERIFLTMLHNLFVFAFGASVGAFALMWFLFIHQPIYEKGFNHAWDLLKTAGNVMLIPNGKEKK